MNPISAMFPGFAKVAKTGLGRTASGLLQEGGVTRFVTEAAPKAARVIAGRLHAGADVLELTSTKAILEVHEGKVRAAALPVVGRALSEPAVLETLTTVVAPTVSKLNGLGLQDTIRKPFVGESFTGEIMASEAKGLRALSLLGLAKADLLDRHDQLAAAKKAIVESPQDKRLNKH